MRQEANILATYPFLLWQQLHNRLQWEDASLLQILEEHRNTSGRIPWLKLHTPMIESPLFLQNMVGHTHWIGTCAVSPDGSFLASGSWDHTLKLWDTRTGQGKTTCYGHIGPVTACAISSDGKFIISGSNDQTLKVWDTQTGQEQATFSGHRNGIKSCAISPDSSYIISLDKDGILKTWDTYTRQEISYLPGCTSYTLAFSLSINGALLVTANLDGTLDVWDMGTRTKCYTLQGDPENLIDMCTISPDNTFIVTVDDKGNVPSPDNNTLTIWDVSSRTQRLTLSGHTGWIWCCAISPDSTFLVSGGADNTLKIWDAQTGDLRDTLYGHTAAVMACALTPDSRYLLSGSKDRTLKLWEISHSLHSVPLVHRETGYGGVQQCAFAATGAFLITAQGDNILGTGKLSIWDIPSSQLYMSLPVRNLSISSDATLLLYQEENHLVGWDVYAQQKVFSSPVVQKNWSMATCTISPDNSYAVTIDKGGGVIVWDMSSGQERYTLIKPQLSHSTRWDDRSLVLISPDCSFILTAITQESTANTTHTLNMWDAQSGQLRRTLRGHTGAISACAISPDGAFIVSGSSAGVLKVWDVASGQERVSLQGHELAISTCVVSPDVSFILSGSHDGTMAIWDSQSGQEVMWFGGLGEPITACSITPDGSLIVTGAEDGTLRVWDKRIEEAIMVFPSLSEVISLAVHPWQPLLCCGDRTGNHFLLEMRDVPLGPIIVTAQAMTADQYSVRCPRCNTRMKIDVHNLGQVVPCSHCALLLRINLFVTIMCSPVWTPSASTRPEKNMQKR